MASNYQTMWQNALDTTFITRVAGSVVSQAIAVAAEVSTTPNHTNRATLAKAAVNSPLQFGQLFALAGLVQAQATVPGASITDAQIDTAVQALWNVFAGVV